MKKLLIFSLLSTLFVSCLMEDDDKFSQSASERLETAVEEATTALQSAANGWRMELYPEGNRIYGGYTVFLKFNADGTVVAASEHADPTQTATSYYTVEGESGAVLSFDTYNEIFHFYSSPSTGAEQGIGTANGGLEGDSDFVVMEASNEFIKLKGRKTNNYAYLYPMESGDWATEMQAYINAAADMEINCKTCTVDGVEYPVTMRSSVNNFTARVFTIAYTPEGEDAETQTITAPYVCTKTGIHFYEPLTIGNKTVSEMTFKEDYYFENEDGSVRISAAEPIRSNNQFTIDVTDITYSGATVQITPTIDDEYYYWDVSTKSSIASMSDKAVMRAFVDNLNSYLSQGYPAESILAGLANMGPFEYTFADALSPDTDYVVVAFGITLLEDGSAFTSTTDLFKEEFTSAEMPPLEEDYEAWLGTWEVTSTSSEVTKTPQTMNITIDVKIPNQSFNITGLGITTLRNVYSIVANYDSETGMFSIANGQKVGVTDGYDITYICLARYNGSYTIVSGSYVGMDAMLGTDKTTAVMAGRSVTITGGMTLPIIGMDFFALKGSSVARFYADDGYTDFDYASGPFTMRKVQTRAAVSQSEAAPLRLKTWKPGMLMHADEVATAVSAE